jgi:hypothetical protein
MGGRLVGILTTICIQDLTHEYKWECAATRDKLASVIFPHLSVLPCAGSTTPFLTLVDQV